MTQSRLILYNQIVDHLSTLLTKVTVKNRDNKTDEAGFAEGLLGDVLNEIFSLALANSNATHGVGNYKAIDLFDDIGKVDVQITTLNQKFAEKKRTTVKGFLENPEREDMELLKI